MGRKKKKPEVKRWSCDLHCNISMDYDDCIAYMTGKKRKKAYERVRNYYYNNKD